MSPGTSRLELADVIARHGAEYRQRHRPSPRQRRVLVNLGTCRTAALGGHVDQCTGCGHVRISYNSCRDRHCPKCQAPRRAQWLAERLERLLPVPYFHVVFTLPHELNPIVLRNKRRLYAMLFRAASRTLLQLGRDETRLGAELGLTAVLHTWGQNLLLHPHLPCVVTGGGLSPDGTRWVPGRGGRRFLFPVPVMAALFRGKVLAALDRAHRAGELELAGSTAALADPMAWAALRDRLYKTRWVVYAKRPFGGPRHVFAYLGRYTHRVAISNARLERMSGGRVTFGVRDNDRPGGRKHLTLDAVEFLRRFLLHVLPRGFTRIRHYGLMASRNVATKLERARGLLAPNAAPAAPSPTEERSWFERFRDQTGIDVMACPSCGARLRRVESLPACGPRASPVPA